MSTTPHDAAATAGPTAATRDPKPPSDGSAARGWLITIAVNIVLPSLTFFVLAGPAGMADVPALLLSGLWPVLEIAWTVRREHHVDEFGIFVLLGIVAAVAISLFSDDARAAFLKDSVVTGLIGMAFLVTTLVGRPLTFYFGRRFATDGSEAQRDWWNGLWRFPQFRSVQRRLGLLWAAALIGEAAVRAFLTYQLGTGPMVVANNVVPYVVIAAMVAVSITVGRRAQARAEAHGAVGVTPPVAES